MFPELTNQELAHYCSSYRGDTDLLFYEDNTLWYNTVSPRRNWRNGMIIESFSLAGWKKCTKLLEKPVLINGSAEALLKSINPYAYEAYLNYRNEGNCRAKLVAEDFLTAPQLEQLLKAGFRFPLYCKAYLGEFNRLTKPGKNLKEIFKTPKYVYTTLKNEYNLKKWESIRKLDKIARVPKEDLQAIVEHNLREDEMRKIEEILKFEVEGKKAFSFPSLMNYLERLDMFQALDRWEALQILGDYLKLCKALGIKPNTDSDSLKREHDVAARNLRLKRDEILNGKIARKSGDLAKFDYSEDVFLIRGVRDYDDLLDEARQQHNCVAGYGESIASGRSLIYFMREVKNPGASLVTVQIQKRDGKYQIVQKYLAHNRPIHNKAQTEFLERWIRHVNSLV